jgi:TolB-like protein
MAFRSFILFFAASLSSSLLIASEISDTSAIQTFTTVAVSDFSILGEADGSAWIGESCADGVTSALIAEPSLRIVERKYLKTIIDELKFQESGLVDERTAMTLGKLTGAKYTILGTATIVRQSVLLRARLVDVQTAEALLSCEAEGAVDELFRLQKEIAQKIALRLTGRTATNDAEKLQGPAPLSSAVRANIQRLKKMSAAFPLFALDPARKRKSAEFTTAGMLCDNIIDRSPEAIDGYYYKALFSMHAEEYEEAAIALRTALRIAPDDREVLLLKSMLLFHTEKAAGAKVLLQFLADSDPRDARIWYGLAKTAAKLNDHPLAVESLVSALQYAPYIPQAETFLESELSQSTFTSRDFTTATAWNAVLLFKKVRGTEGSLGSTDLPLTVSVARAYPGLYLPYFAAGLIQTSLGNRAEAERSFRQCLALAPALPLIHRELAYISLRSGRCSEGKYHAELYIQTSQSINDYQQLRGAMERCQ